MLPPTVYQRCRHVITENDRVQRAATALKRGDVREFGRLMFESHRSLRDDYQVSCPELDLLVEAARPLPGVYGARMTGGGFGGCTINLVETQYAQGFQKSLTQAYREKTGTNSDIFACKASQGAEVVPA